MGSSTLKFNMSQLILKALAIFFVATSARSSKLPVAKEPMNVHYNVDMGPGNDLKLVCHSTSVKDKTELFNIMKMMMNQKTDESIAVGDTNDFDMICTSGDQSCHLSGKGQIEYGSQFNALVDMMNDSFNACIDFEDRWGVTVDVWGVEVGFNS